MRSLNDAEEQVGNLSVCLSFLSFFFFFFRRVLYFFRVTRLIKASNYSPSPSRAFTLNPTFETESNRLS